MARKQENVNIDKLLDDKIFNVKEDLLIKINEHMRNLHSSPSKETLSRLELVEKQIESLSGDFSNFLKKYEDIQKTRDTATKTLSDRMGALETAIKSNIEMFEKHTESESILIKDINAKLEEIHPFQKRAAEKYIFFKLLNNYLKWFFWFLAGVGGSVGVVYSLFNIIN